MKITPVNYNYTTQNNKAKMNNQQSFGATIPKETLADLAEDLVQFLAHGETKNFLTEIKKSPELIQKIKFEGIKDVSITAGFKSSDPIKKIATFSVQSKLIGEEGSAESIFNINDQNNLLAGDSGRTVAKKFIKAIKKATDDIVEDITYLRAKAEETADVINPRRHGCGKKM